MSADPTLDFLASGGGEPEKSSGDPTLDFLTSGGEHAEAERTTASNVRDFAKGTAVAGAYQTLAQAAGPTSILDPNTWRGAAETVKNLPHTLDRAAATAGQWIADPVRAWNEKVAQPASQMTPEQLGAHYGPAAIQAAAVVLPPLFGGLRALGAASDIGSMPKGVFGTGAAPGAAEAGARSVGAAEASPLAAFEGASPELQNAAKEIVQSGGKINPVVAERHIEADTLPVPVRLSEGQATQDPKLVSSELNNRAQGGGAFADFLKGQNDALKENVQEIRGSVGPDVFTTSRDQHGDTLIQAYKDLDAPRVAEIDQAYQQLRDAAGGEFPVDGKAFATNAEALLKKNLKSDFLPPGIRSSLERFSSGEPMSFEDFEAMRTNLASEMRDNPSGNARAASGLVRQALEDLPLQGGAADLKPIADKARTLAKARFAAIEADPAYEAAINDKVAPDDFVRKFVTGGKRDNVATMRANLGENPVAAQTMGVAALDDLRDAAGIDRNGGGTFSQAGYNRAFSRLSSKIGSLFAPEHAKQLEQLGNVANYTQFQPKGSWVNNSNTWVSALGDIGEGVANAKTGGLYGLGKKVLEPVLGARRVARQTAPGVGLDWPPAPPGTPK